MPMFILFVVFFGGGGDMLIFVVKKSACFGLCLLGVGSFQLKKEGMDKKKYEYVIFRGKNNSI